MPDNNSLTFGIDLLPAIDDTYYLGTTGQAWKIFGNVTGNADTATGANLTSTTNGIAYYSNTTGTFASTGAGTEGYLLTGKGNNAAPEWAAPPIWWGKCETNAGTTAKIVSCPGFTLTDGAVVLVYFTATNSGAVGSLTLNVNNTGAKSIKYLNNGNDPANIPDKGYLRAGNTYVFHYYHIGTTEYWVVRLHYNTNSVQKTFASSTNIALPIAGINLSNSATATYTSYTSGSKDAYAAIPATAANVATINPSTGAINVPGGLTAATVNSYTLDAACAKAVDSDTMTSSSTNLPTAKAVAAYITSCGFLTSQNTANLYATTSSGTSNVTSNQTDPYLTLIDGNTTSRIKLKGDGQTSVVANNGTVTISTNVTAGNLNLSSALRFVGTTSTQMSDGYEGIPAGISDNYIPILGDVVLDRSGQNNTPNNEYVCINISNAIPPVYTWELLGGDSSFKIQQTAFENINGTDDNEQTSLSFIYSFSQNANGDVYDIKSRSLPVDTDGYKFVPATGTTNEGKFLKAGSQAGAISWTAITWSDIDNIPSVAKGVEGLCPALPNENTTTKFLCQNGTWQVPNYIVNINYGNINTNGEIGVSTNWTLEENDGLIVFDSNNSNKIERSSITFDASTTDQFLAKDGNWHTITAYSLPVATSSALGGIKIGYSQNSKNYPVQLDNQKAYVNVPWTDTNTMVNYTLGATTKAYLMASQNAPTSTTTARAAHGDTKVYLTSTAGQLSATSYSINNGTDEKARLQWNATDSAIEFIFN